MNKIISVVIPAYNHEAYIQETVMSVLSQTIRPVEIIIVDDGSTDNTRQICHEISSVHPIVKLISQENKGAHEAINRGIEIAKSRYIAILNSDDLFMSDKIKTCTETIENNPGVEFLAHAILFIDENGKAMKKGIVLDWYERALSFYRKSELLGLSILNENFVVTTSNMVFSKSLWESSGGFQALRYCHDLEFLLAAARQDASFLLQNKKMTKYRVHPANTIKENINKVRVEIAAVTAQAIVDGNIKLLNPDNPKNYLHFRKFLRNKNISDLVLFLIMQYLHVENKSNFYNDVLPGLAVNNCIQLMD